MYMNTCMHGNKRESVKYEDVTREEDRKGKSVCGCNMNRQGPFIYYIPTSAFIFLGVIFLR